MQDESLYTYSKEHGWHLSRYEAYDFTYQGRPARVVAKKPEIGELGAYTYPTEGRFFRGGKVNLVHFAEWFGLDWVRPQSEESFKLAERQSSMLISPLIWVTFYVDA